MGLAGQQARREIFPCCSIEAFQARGAGIGSPREKGTGKPDFVHTLSRGTSSG